MEHYEIVYCRGGGLYVPASSDGIPCWHYVGDPADLPCDCVIEAIEEVWKGAAPFPYDKVSPSNWDKREGDAWCPRCGSRLRQLDIRDAQGGVGYEYLVRCETCNQAFVWNTRKAYESQN